MQRLPTRTSGQQELFLNCKEALPLLSATSTHILHATSNAAQVKDTQKQFGDTGKSTRHEQYGLIGVSGTPWEKHITSLLPSASCQPVCSTTSSATHDDTEPTLKPSLHRPTSPIHPRLTQGPAKSTVTQDVMPEKEQANSHICHLQALAQWCAVTSDACWVA